LTFFALGIKPAWGSAASNNTVSYGVEIKNTLEYMPRREFEVKIRMCHFLDLRPLFIVRMAPSSYIEELRRAGGFTLVFGYQLYPYTHGELAKQVRERFQLPVDCPTSIQEGTINRFLNWHLKSLSQTKPNQTNSY
jgi:hypothetical protein